MEREANKEDKMIEIKFRKWGYAKTLYHSFWEHLLSWCFGLWIKSNACGVWEDSGFRVLGIEINYRKYKALI